ncbi:MAG TPA: acyl-CoA dehydrogenase family protein [Acidimicrobiales bacterium]|nr:acyl-CoA dehydrogenase family protein [Acidimicrobiales bacterium]
MAGGHPIVVAARRSADLAAEQAAASESARALHADVVEALRTAGLFRMLVPAVYGGPEVDALSMVEAIEAVSRGDGAAGWCVMVASTTSSMSLFLPPDGARELFGDPATVAAGVFAPQGRAVPDGDGFVVSGRWGWGSGADHSDWFAGGAIVDGAGMRLCFVPRDEVRLLDTWHTSGLRGTASNDVEIDGAVVPEHRTIEPLRTRAVVDAPLAHFPNFTLLACGVAAVALGIARRAVDELVVLAGAKVPAHSRKRLAESPLTQVDVARAEAALSSARAFLVDEVGRAWADVVAGAPLDGHRRARIRLACTHAVAGAVTATDLAYHAGGGSSVFASSPLQRCFRDVHTATQHVMVGPRTYETVGRLALGLDADTSML